MGNKVILKRSSVADKAPTTVDLDYGELALNYTDGRLYYRTNADEIDYFSVGGANTVPNTQFKIYSYIATASQTTFSGADSNANVLEYAANNIAVYVNGIKISESDYIATNGTSLILNSGADLNDLVEIISFKTINVLNQILSQFRIYNYTATASQTTFTGADNTTQILEYAPGFINVFLNGIKLAESDYTATNGTSVVLDVAASAGELLEIVSFKAVTLWNDVNSDFKNYQYTATASQTTFTGVDDNTETLDYTPGFISVFLNGVKLSADDYVATNGTSVVLDVGASLNDIVEIVSFKTINISSSPFVATLTGTTNQITVAGEAGVSSDLTISLPQDIHTAATPTFAGVNLANGRVRSVSLTTSDTTSNQVLDTISATTFRSVKYQIQVTSSTSYHVTEVVVVHDGADTFVTEYGTITTGASLATFTADVSSGNVRLLTTPANAITTYKVLASAINA